MVKNRLKKLIISFILFIIIIPIPFVIANSIPASDIVLYSLETVYNQNDTYNSTHYTKMDDLSENLSKGTKIRTELEVTLEEKNLKNYDIEVTTKGTNTLYFNEYLSIFKVKNNKTGYVWSTGSEYYDADKIKSKLANQLSSTIILGYYHFNPETKAYGDNVNYLYLVRNSKNAETNQLEIKPATGVIVKNQDITNGKKLTITYTTQGFEINAYITLDDNGDLIVDVPNDEMKEKIGTSKELIARVMLAPGIGANIDGTEPGYLVIPDGSGALIRYGEKTGNEKIIHYYGPDYGNPSSSTANMDTEYLTMPIYGFVNGIKQNGCLAIIEDGATDCDLNIGINGAITSNYNYLSNSFVLHTRYLLYGINSTVTETMPTNDCKIRFKLLDGDDATYVGMANAYQDYLLENDYLEKTTDGTFRLRLDVLMSEAVKALIGSTNTVMTSLKDLQKVIDNLSENNINDLLLVLMGWNKDGLSGTTPHDLKYNTKVGSKNEFKNFVKNQTKQNNPVYFYNDFVHAGEIGEYSSRNDISRTIQRIRNVGTWEANVYDEYAYLYPKSTYKLAKESVKKYNKLNIENLALNTIGYDLFTTYYKGDINRRDSAAYYYDKTLDMFTDKDFMVALFEPFVYLWKYTNAYLDIPFYTNQYNFYTDTVPLLHYTLRGTMDYYASYTNFYANQNLQLLRALDFGAMPSFIITTEESRKLKYTDSYQLFTTVYNDWNDTIIKNYHLISDGFNAIKDSRVIDREVMEAGLIKNTYANNVKIIIDYRNLRYKIEGGASEWKTLI